jgi:hypothetical protein
MNEALVDKIINEQTAWGDLGKSIDKPIIGAELANTFGNGLLQAVKIASSEEFGGTLFYKDVSEDLLLIVKANGEIHYANSDDNLSQNDAKKGEQSHLHFLKDQLIKTLLEQSEKK